MKNKMNPAAFKPGDLVALVSGGPAMTIQLWEESIFAGGPGWACVWSCQGSIRRETLPAHVLVLLEPPGSRQDGLAGEG